MSLTKTNKAKLQPHCPMPSLLNLITSEPWATVRRMIALADGTSAARFHLNCCGSETKLRLPCAEVRLLVIPFRWGFRSGPDVGVLYPRLFQQER
ncbi:hypothetical protein T10_3970 [Trichinella papuae]|uniref:Uncharacterized protein n=1 Tax=Trichinella papuae TaxID=268474 RepID=A0A0V1MHJ9_9BILA|nr:hypothetical protein T10_3970 [Trichinella papuae]